MSPNKAYIALGSNLGDSELLVKQAITAVANLPSITMLTTSSFYRTPPLGPQDQADYLNAVISLETSLAPIQLLEALQAIEIQYGRIREGHRWGPRTLDLDILLYANEIIQTEKLTIPHYDLQNRSFVITPLYEIAPTLILPNGITIKELFSRLSKDHTLPYWYSDQNK